ncbi:MAG TPA: RDD family protein [Acidimicrobiales bacterium]|nr:RDD family protein [Acidimicrobiales bacterium]
MNCAQCGSEVDGAFCPVCGTPVAAPTNAVALSGWWRRVGATVVDNLLLFIPSSITFLLVNDVAGRYVGALAALVVQGAYMVRFLASPRGQTIGNRVVDTCVRDALTGMAISSAQAMRRWGFVAIYGVLDVTLPASYATIPTLFALIDCLFPLFDARKQTLHDKFAGTLVVRV